MRNIFLLLLAALFISSAWTSHSSNAYIQWSHSRRLTWDDFRGFASSSSYADAATAIHISAKPFYHRRKLYYDVNAYFIPDRSWFRDKSEKLLQHEQLHFDIAELYARKVRKKISEYSQMGIRDVHEYNRAVVRILEESNNADVKYDFATLHGTLPDEQLHWEKTIQQELQILIRFSSENWK